MITTFTNLKNNAITQLTEYNFNSYCQFGEHFLACGGGRVARVGGTGGNPDPMVSYFETFSGKLGYDGNKRIGHLYLGVETDGPITVTPIFNGVYQPPIVFNPYSTGIMNMTEKVGRGERGVYCAFRVESNCWFSINTLKGSPVYLSDWPNSFPPVTQITNTLKGVDGSEILAFDGTPIRTVI